MFSNIINNNNINNYTNNPSCLNKNINNINLKIDKLIDIPTQSLIFFNNSNKNINKILIIKKEFNK